VPTTAADGKAKRQRVPKGVKILGKVPLINLPFFSALITQATIATSSITR